ncbi:rhomboid family intramembrane serine protease [Antrihabitans sp. YC2-6]|uniref:rhomboid family intramembrane serine protease n=1 Tax=Antrihabitans sp. YC2-6 TaxID=2799498 RepID=UPI0018F6EC95|nr:rhomboid family intramembrane serine protease [Antrihabitans sp. YC2-6]MBJ8346414.1 rhomboid family intramembrane serine protease [Antrihabitans sp. YC2-6]
MSTGGGYPPPPTCVRHPDRPTGLSCNRCGRPSCADCLREAAVGFQCVDCVRQGRSEVRQVRTVAGAPARSTATPVVTYALIALNVLVFAITAVQSSNLMDNERGSRLFADWALWAPAVANGEFVRVVGSGFLHFGPVHLLVNMLALYVVGKDVELVLGWARYLAVYLTSLLGGAAAVLALQDNAVTAGASGAIFGLFGAMAVILIRIRQSPGPVLAMIVINVIISVSIPGISLWGHLGGLAAGTAATVGLLFAPGWLRRAGTNVTDSTARLVGWLTVVGVAVFAVAVVCVRALQIRTELGL